MGLLTGNIPTADDLVPRGIVYQSNRSTTKVTAGASVEVGVTRLDGMALQGGRGYVIYTSPLRFQDPTIGTVDHWKAQLRWAGGGAAATTSSTSLNQVEGGQSNDSQGQCIGYLNPTVDDTVSVVLTLVRTTGGTDGISLLADVAGIWLTVEDIGVAVPDTGIDL